MTNQRSYKRDVRHGADAFLALLTMILTKSEADFAAAFEAGADLTFDARDWPTLVQLIGDNIAANMTNAAPAHREGYLRALADLLCFHVAGCHPASDWDPIENTAAAFDANAHAVSAIGAAR